MHEKSELTKLANNTISLRLTENNNIVAIAYTEVFSHSDDLH